MLQGSLGQLVKTLVIRSPCNLTYCRAHTTSQQDNDAITAGSDPLKSPGKRGSLIEILVYHDTESDGKITNCNPCLPGVLYCILEDRRKAHLLLYNMIGRFHNALTPSSHKKYQRSKR